MAEQAYKTQTAENDYLRSGVELDRAYQQNDFQDNLLVQAGKEADSPEPNSFDTDDTESINSAIELIESKESSIPDEKEEMSSYSESDIESMTAQTVDQETALPMEEMDDGLLLYQQPNSEEDEPHQIDQTEENRGDDHIEPPRFMSELDPQLVPVEPEEAKQLAKEMGELRQETYEEVEIDEELAYEAL